VELVGKEMPMSVKEKQPRIEVYEHHGLPMHVFSLWKGKHRGICRCTECGKFNPEDREDNCGIANGLYRICVEEGVVTPVLDCPWRDPQFESDVAWAYDGFHLCDYCVNEDDCAILDKVSTYAFGQEIAWLMAECAHFVPKMEVDVYFDEVLPYWSTVDEGE
jgi:hypothetical protein